MKRRYLVVSLFAAVVIALLVAGCGNGKEKSSKSADSASVEKPAAMSPGMDRIPDTLDLITYKPANGKFEILVPRGWTEVGTENSFAFSDGINVLYITFSGNSIEPNINTARTVEAPELRNTERAFKLTGIEEVTLPAGKAILVKYKKNSEPDTRDGSQYRVDVRQYEFFRNGEVATLILESPSGSENETTWDSITASFKWL